MVRTALPLLTLALATALHGAPAAAFCVYNKSGNTDVDVHIVAGGESDLHVRYGHIECCNWKHPTCNEAGMPEAIVTLDLALHTPAGLSACRTALPANGKIDVIWDVHPGASRSGARAKPVLTCRAMTAHGHLIAEIDGR